MVDLAPATIIKRNNATTSTPLGVATKIKPETVVAPDEPTIQPEGAPVVDTDGVVVPQEDLREKPKMSRFEQKKKERKAYIRDKRAEFGIDPIEEEGEEDKDEQFRQPERIPSGDKPFGQNLLDFVDTTPDEKITDKDLEADIKFIEAAAIIFRMNNGRNFDVNRDVGTLGEYGIRLMGYFNYNLTKMTFDAKRISTHAEVQQRAFLYMMESYDDLGLSLAGTERFIKGVGTDPFSIAGLSTLGLGFIGAASAKIAGKITTKKLIQAGLSASIVSAVEGGMYMAVDSVNRQVVEDVKTGAGVTLKRTATDAAIGAGISAVLGGVLSSTVSGISTLISKNLPEVKTGNKKLDGVEIDGELKTGPAKDVQSILAQVIKAVRKTTTDKPIAIDANGTRNIIKLKQIIKPISDLLKSARSKKPKEIETYLRNQAITPDQMRVLKATAAKAASDIKITHKNILKEMNNQTDPVKRKALRTQADEIEESVMDIDLLDQALGSSTGRELEARKFIGINKNDIVGMNVKSLMDTGLNRTEAEEQIIKAYDRAELKFEQDVVIREAQEKINTISAKGIPEGAAEIQIQKEIQKAAKDKLYKIGLEEMSGTKRFINEKFLKPLSEFMIGVVFSPATVLINMVPSVAKTLYKPFVNAIAFGGPKSPAVALKKMMAEYSSMISFMPVAMKSAKFAFLNEQAILTGNYNRLLEGQTQSLPGMFGRLVRLFPRVLLATDAFFEQIHYRGYIAGTTTADAMQAGINKGLKGKKLEKHVKEAMKDAMKKAYDQGDDVLERLTTMGTAKGLKGKKLNIWVRKQMQKNPQILKEAKNENGKNYVRDLLFKRGFGDGMDTTSWQGRMASDYEQFVSKNPAMRIMGQLFFRTPIRVFEEGIRMTPGLQFIAPRFMDDLLGKNGNARQIRANGEAMVGLAIAAYTYTQWSQNKATGAGPLDYDQKRGLDAAGLREPYTMTNSDGSTWSFRYVDPFATPIKIIVNMFERSEALMYRVEQGERLDMNEYEKINGWVSASVGSIAQSFRDASLLSGVVEVWKLLSTTMSDKSTDEMRKFSGRKISSLVPNTWYKIQLQNNPELADPLTLEQFILNKAFPGHKKVPRKHSPLGRPLEIASPAGKLSMFDLTTVAERERGMSAEELQAERYIVLLSEATNSSFVAPYKHKLFNGDLRTQMMPDGSMTMYDRWMEIVNTKTYVQRSIAALARAKTPFGNPTASLGKNMVREILTEARDVAAYILLKEVRKADERFVGDIIKKEVREALSLGGRLDVQPPITSSNNKLLNELNNNK